MEFEILAPSLTLTARDQEKEKREKREKRDTPATTGIHLFICHAAGEAKEAREEIMEGWIHVSLHHSGYIGLSLPFPYLLAFPHLNLLTFTHTHCNHKRQQVKITVYSSITQH